jgi:hypothetical protein
MTEKMKMKLTVAIARDELKKMESESVPDYNKNAEGIFMFTNAKN